MAKKDWTILNGALIIKIDEKYDIYEKPIPEGIDDNINWLGNFGVSEKKTGKKIDGKVPKYEIELPDNEGKKLYFWSDGKAKEVPGQKSLKKNKKKYRKGELDLGDPAVGWEK